MEKKSNNPEGHNQYTKQNTTKRGSNNPEGHNQYTKGNQKSSGSKAPSRNQGSSSQMSKKS